MMREAPDTQRKRDMGAFFKSIHGTLNHIVVVGDHMWMARALGAPRSSLFASRRRFGCRSRHDLRGCISGAEADD
jgi:uncharacterized damage-inducible protein DinB